MESEIKILGTVQQIEIKPKSVGPDEKKQEIWERIMNSPETYDNMFHGSPYNSLNDSQAFDRIIYLCKKYVYGFCM